MMVLAPVIRVTCVEARGRGAGWRTLEDPAVYEVGESVGVGGAPAV